jgi:polyisoprenoid-binding protein YceI
MHVTGPCLLWRVAGGFLLALLAGCPVRAPPPAAQAGVSAAAPQAAGLPAAHVGRPYDIVPQESLLTILVFRGGTLAGAGHNHIIASHSLSGTIYVPGDLAGASFEARLPLLDLTVDEAALRAGEMSRDFPPDVSDSAKEGTRRNMLGAALLNAADFPQITLRSESLAPVADGMVQVRMQTEVRGQQRVLLVPVRYERSDATVIASGELPVSQSSLGLTPFSAMLGALQVQDEMRVRFRIVARVAQGLAR